MIGGRYLAGAIDGKTGGNTGTGVIAEVVSASLFGRPSSEPVAVQTGLGPGEAGVHCRYQPLSLIA